MFLITSILRRDDSVDKVVRTLVGAWGAGSTRLFFSGGEMWECGVGSRGALQTLAAYRVGANLAELLAR